MTTEIIQNIQQKYKRLDKIVIEGNVGWGSWREYVRVFLGLKDISSILEVGFNAGHSSVMLLECFPDADVVSIDIPSNVVCKQGKQLIDEWYPDKHSLILEDSTVSLPKLDNKFDLIFVDGSHEPGYPEQDIRNSQKLAHNNTIIFIDDTYGNQSYHIEPYKALQKVISLGIFKEVGRWVSLDFKLGFSWGRFTNNKFSVLIGCYGSYPQYSLRAVHSVINADKSYPIHVATSDCCKETIEGLQDLFSTRKIDSLLMFNQNINKDPMMRQLIERTDTEFVLWMDDDSHFVNNRWSSILYEFINNNEFDVAGHVHYFTPDNLYKEYRNARPWWRGEEYFIDSSHRNKTWFATGGAFLARTDYLREHDFPDRLMIKRMDDILLGDLISQTHGILIGFPTELLRALKISDGNRRGSGEMISDWKF